MAKLILFMKMEKDLNQQEVAEQNIFLKKHLNVIFLILSACLALLGSNVAIICLCFFLYYKYIYTYIHVYMLVLFVSRFLNYNIIRILN